ncbi:MAG: alkaline shock response membrane anchor protein AmaP [Tissierellales bacterium]|jgi:uncharacterized alkaline shock family protein YloU|nr:alkaline shock response membrane anchor protein AmaP [Tissierellales bacterium]
MKFFRGFLIALYALIMMGLGVVIFAYPFGVFGMSLDSMVTIYRIGTQPAFVYMIIGVVLVILSLVVLFAGGGKSEPRIQFIVRETELGELKISDETIKGLGLSALEKFSELKDVSLKVKLTKEGQMDIEVRAKINNDSNIPEITENAQKSVKDTIENCSGLPVKSIQMEITSLTGNSNDLLVKKGV